MNEIPIFKFAIREDLKDTGDIFLPKQGTSKSTGWDVKAAWEDRKPKNIVFGERVKIPLGFRTFVPEGWWYELRPRSSTFAKKNLHSLYGAIDEDYEGQLIFVCQYLPNFSLESFQNVWGNLQKHKNYIITERENNLCIEFGEAIGQIVPVKRQEMQTETISNEEFDLFCKNRSFTRGADGFGSTGK